MKICLVAQTFAPQHEGGAEVSSRHGATHLARNHDVVVLALGKGNSGPTGIGEHLTKAPWRLHRIEFRGDYLPEARQSTASLLNKVIWHTKTALGAVRQEDLRNFFLREKFDLIYAQNAMRLQPHLFKVAAEMGIPVVQHLRDYALLCARTSMFRKGENCKKVCLPCKALTQRARANSGHVGTVIAVSQFVKDRYQSEGVFSHANWHVLNNTNTARSDFDTALLTERPAPAGPLVFGYLGALSPEKGVEDLVRAFAALPPDLGCRLLMAGRGVDAFVSGLRALGDSLCPGRIEWLGHVPPSRIFQNVEVVIVPSLWHEPQSRVLIEAATYGVPVIAARTGGSPEIVEGERTGWCYDPKQPSQLAALMADAANGGAALWRQRLPQLFSGLQKFRGTAEDTQYYAQLEQILYRASSRGTT